MSMMIAEGNSTVIKVANKEEIKKWQEFIDKANKNAEENELISTESDPLELVETQKNEIQILGYIFNNYEDFQKWLSPLLKENQIIIFYQTNSENTPEEHEIIFARNGYTTN